MLLNVTTTITKDASTARVAGVDVLEEYEDGTMLIRPSNVQIAAGASRRDPHDRFNKEIAFDLAVGRALRQTGKKFLKRGNGLVKHFDDMQQVKSEQEAANKLFDETEATIATTLQDIYGRILSSETFEVFTKSLGLKITSNASE